MKHYFIETFGDVAKCSVIALVGITAGGAITSCDAQEPVVITDDQNNLLDMPPGVQWDMQFDIAIDGVEYFVETCNHMGGDPDIVTFVCHDVDY